MVNDGLERAKKYLELLEAYRSIVRELMESEG